MLQKLESILKPAFILLTGYFFSILHIICKIRDKEKELKTNLLWNAIKKFRK